MKGDSDPGEFETQDVRGSGERKRRLSLDPGSAAAFLPSLIHSTNVCCQLHPAVLQNKAASAPLHLRSGGEMHGNKRDKGETAD